MPPRRMEVDSDSDSDTFGGVSKALKGNAKSKEVCALPFVLNLYRLFESPDTHGKRHTQDHGILYRKMRAVAYAEQLMDWLH
jgi:hypothetical protein